MDGKMGEAKLFLYSLVSVRTQDAVLHRQLPIVAAPLRITAFFK